MNRLLAMLFSAAALASFGCQSHNAPSRPVIGITSVYRWDPQEKSAYTLVNFAYVRAVASGAD